MKQQIKKKFELLNDLLTRSEDLWCNDKVLKTIDNYLDDTIGDIRGFIKDEEDETNKHEIEEYYENIESESDWLKSAQLPRYNVYKY